jgi:hypothetical protein
VELSPTAAPAGAAGPAVAVVAHDGLVAVAGEVVALPMVGEPVGIVTIKEPSPTLPALGNALGSGTAGVELTPRLPIS